MLKGIDALIGPELLHALARAGHGDLIAVVDRNYPAYSAGPPVLRMDGVDTTRAIQAVLSLVPLDTFIPHPLSGMDPGGRPTPASHAEILDVAARSEGRGLELSLLERHAFYAACRTATAVVATSDARPFSCFLLSKGVV